SDCPPPPTPTSLTRKRRRESWFFGGTFFCESSGRLFRAGCHRCARKGCVECGDADKKAVAIGPRIGGGSWRLAAPQPPLRSDHSRTTLRPTTYDPGSSLNRTVALGGPSSGGPVNAPSAPRVACARIWRPPWVLCVGVVVRPTSPGDHARRSP